MKAAAMYSARGFTLIELLTALLILSALALMSYRGLGAVLDAREHVTKETDKWRRVAAFVDRFERDVKLAAPRPVRSASGTAPAWRGIPGSATEPLLEFSRFASVDGMDSARRLGYRLNDRQEIELWLWPGLDIAPGALPARYPVLAAVTAFDQAPCRSSTQPGRPIKVHKSPSRPTGATLASPIGRMAPSRWWT